MVIAEIISSAMIKRKVQIKLFFKNGSTYNNLFQLFTEFHIYYLCCTDQLECFADKVEVYQ